MSEDEKFIKFMKERFNENKGEVVYQNGYDEFLKSKEDLK